MLYQMTLLAVRPGTPNAVARISEWVAKSAYKGQFLACWQSELGVIGQVLLLHGYEDLESISHDRETVAQSPERYGIGDGLASASTQTFRPFPVFAPLQPGNYGPVFEVRSYVLRVGAMAPTIESWTKALPERMKLSKPLLIMHSTDGIGPRLVHIWPYSSLADRERVRQQAAELGVWPPHGGGGGPPVTMQSEIFLPAPSSPIC